MTFKDKEGKDVSAGDTIITAYNSCGTVMVEKGKVIEIIPSSDFMSESAVKVYIDTVKNITFYADSVDKSDDIYKV